MPTIGQVASGTSQGLSLAKSLVPAFAKTALMSNPWTASAVIGGTALLSLVDKIGQGRKAANKFTQNGGPQDIINKQLAAISSSQASAQEKAQATENAWVDFLAAANQFAAANPKQSTVVQQAIYKTPELTSTVQSLLGANPLDAKYTSMAQPGIQTGAAGKNPGPSVWGTIGRTALNVGLPFAMDKLQGRSIANIGGTPEWDPTTGGWSTTPSTPGTPGVPNLPNTNSSTTRQQSLLQQLFPTLVSSGTSLISGLIASRAAGRAADVQTEAADRSAELQAQAGREAIQFNRDALAQQQENIQPWIDAGSGALRSIADITNAPGYGFSKTFTPPTPEEAMQDPGIQFQLQQGQRALDAYLKSSGLSLSGKAVKDITRFGQDVASTGYQNVYNRRRGEFDTEYNVFANERSARLNPQLSLAGLGQTSVGQLNSDVGNMGANLSNITMSTARNVGEQQANAAAARASGYAAGGNIWGTSIADIGNNILDQATLQQILRRMPAGGAA